MIFASGDSGVPCLSTKRGVVFGAGTPTNCPYVTSVGGTKIARGNSVYEPEVAVYYGYAPNFNTYSSGGGFSVSKSMFFVASILLIMTRTYIHAQNIRKRPFPTILLIMPRHTHIMRTEITITRLGCTIGTAEDSRTLRRVRMRRGAIRYWILIALQTACICRYTTTVSTAREEVELLRQHQVRKMRAKPPQSLCHTLTVLLCCR